MSAGPKDLDRQRIDKWLWHVLGSNYFHYVRDPWGSFSEYSCDIDYIPKDERWPAADHKPEDSFYLWGPDVPREFTINYEGGES